jgi:hypothetical protein
MLQTTLSYSSLCIKIDVVKAPLVLLELETSSALATKDNLEFICSAENSTEQVRVELRKLQQH